MRPPFVYDRRVSGSVRPATHWAIASTFGKVVNLLNVELPPQEQEILIKVRFADVDRSKSRTLGAGILEVAPGKIPVQRNNRGQ